MTEKLSFASLGDNGLPRMVVIGAGAIGCYVGVSLSCQSQVPITFIGRKNVQQRAKQFGLQICINKLGIKDNLFMMCNHRDRDFRTELTKELVRDHDIFLLATKTTENEAIAQRLGSLLEDERPRLLVALQNGVTSAKVLGEHLPSNFTVCQVVVNFNVVPVDVGVWKRTSRKAVLWVPNLKDTVVENEYNLFVDLCRKSRMDVHVDDQFKRALYSKLFINMNNSLNALSGVTVKEMMLDYYYRVILSTLYNEALEVFKAAGVGTNNNITAGAPAWLFKYVLWIPNWIFMWTIAAAIPEGIKTSMLVDLERGKSTEIEELNGELSRIAHEVDVPTPLNDALTRLIKKAEREKKSPAYRGVDLHDLLKQQEVPFVDYWHWPYAVIMAIVTMILLFKKNFTKTSIGALCIGFIYAIPYFYN